MIKLRPYQEKAIHTIKETFKSKDRQFIEMPTGSGKTVTFLSYARSNHPRVLVIVPSKELLKQVYESSLMFYKRNEVTRKGARFEETPKNDYLRTGIITPSLHICIINSIRGDYLEYLTEFPFDLVIIDECHHIQTKSYINYIQTYLQRESFRSCIYKKTHTKFLGVTATPDRLDALNIKEILDECSFKLDIESLIEDKFLSDIEGYSVKTKIDLSDIDDHNGDFSLSQLFKKLNTESRNAMIVDICKNDMKDRKTLIFCINIEHSKEITHFLQIRGIHASHIDGKMDDKERNSILNSFRNNEINVLCNCQLLTEGFDEPSIDGIIIARPTRSRALFSQMIGRGLRIFPGKKNCKIIDIVDNHKSLAGFTNLLVDGYFPDISSFTTIKDIRSHLENENLKITEYIVTRSDLFKRKGIDDYEPTPSLYRELEKHNIYFQEPISFDEANFLVWMNQLKMEYKNGCN